MEHRAVGEAAESCAMLGHRRIRQHAQELFGRRETREEALVGILGHAEGGALGAHAYLVKGRLPGDENRVLVVGHPEIGDDHPALVAAEAALRAAGALVELQKDRLGLKELVQHVWRWRVRLATEQTGPTNEPLRHHADQR